MQVLSERKWEGIVKEFEMDMYAPPYSQWITNKDLLYSTGNSAQCYVPAWMGAGFGGEWMHGWLNPFTAHLKLSQHCLLISHYNIKSFKKYHRTSKMTESIL